MSDERIAVDPRSLGLGQLFLKFLGFGARAFGGPVAQIAMVREELIARERWIDPARFNRLLAVLQALPGPEAHELCVHLGMVARGRIGGVLAGLGFMLPGLALMLVAGWAYVTWVGRFPALAGVLLGVQVVVLAIILRAVVRIGQHILEERLLWAIGIGSLAATLMGVPFWLLLIAGGAVYALWSRRWMAIAVTVIVVLLAALLHQRAPTSAVTIAASDASMLALFVAGLKGGLLTFGGAYTAIPYVRSDTVGRGWIDDANFLDGIALAGVLPAPLVIFATFVGYVAGGLPGALAITAGMFLPAFAFSLILFERMEALVESAAFHRLLNGVAAAVVGIVAATLVDLARVVARSLANPLLALLLFVVALAIAWRVRGGWVTPALILIGAVTGALIAL